MPRRLLDKMTPSATFTLLLCCAPFWVMACTDDEQQDPTRIDPGDEMVMTFSFENALEVEAQGISQGDTVQIARVTIEAPSFVVVRASTPEGLPSSVLGFTYVAQSAEDVDVQLERAMRSSELLYATLHLDTRPLQEGEELEEGEQIKGDGAFDFPTNSALDPPALGRDGLPVSESFQTDVEPSSITVTDQAFAFGEEILLTVDAVSVDTRPALLAIYDDDISPTSTPLAVYPLTAFSESDIRVPLPMESFVEEETTLKLALFVDAGTRGELDAEDERLNDQEGALIEASAVVSITGAPGPVVLLEAFSAPRADTIVANTRVEAFEMLTNQSAFIAIFAAQGDGEAGELLGVRRQTGASEDDVAITLGRTLLQGEPLLARLYDDIGEEGVFERDIDTPVVRVDGELVEQLFTIDALGVDEAFLTASNQPAGDTLLVRQAIFDGDGLVVAFELDGNNFGDTLGAAPFSQVEQDISIVLDRATTSGEEIILALYEDLNNNGSFDDEDRVVLRRGGRVLTRVTID